MVMKTIEKLKTFEAVLYAEPNNHHEIDQQ